MDLVIFPFHDTKKWINEGWRTRDAHLVKHFEKDSRVGRILVVSRPVSLAETVVRHQGWRTPGLEPIAEGPSRQLSKLSDKTFCLDTKLPDFMRVARERKAWWFSAFENPRTIDSVNWAIDRLGFNQTVLLIQNPMAVAAARHLDRSLFAFDAIDNWLHHPQMRSNHDQVARSYDYVRGHADLILTVSKALADDFSNAKTNSVKWVPNGVDPEFFAPARRAYDGGVLTVGYMGKIQDRVDFDLVRRCLDAYPDTRFKFIGPAYSQQDVIRELDRDYENIEFTGDVHYDNLPGAMRDVDLALIPHKVNQFTASMNPLKLYEYLAAGKPVVSTDVAGVAGLSRYVRVADSAEEFVSLVGDAARQVRDGDIDPEEVAVSIPQASTWDYRANEVIDFIQAQLEGGSDV